MDSLARLWFGDVSAARLALAGIIRGAPEAAGDLSRLFATAVGPVNLNDF